MAGARPQSANAAWPVSRPNCRQTFIELALSCTVVRQENSLEVHSPGAEPRSVHHRYCDGALRYRRPPRFSPQHLRQNQHGLPDRSRVLCGAGAGCRHAGGRVARKALSLRHVCIYSAFGNPLHLRYGQALTSAKPQAARHLMAETLSLQAARLARPSPPGANRSPKVIIAFALVYVFWGSTYLAIGITSAAGIPPFGMCALRFAIAGPLMLAACALFGRRVLISRPEAVRLAAVGGLLLVGGNGGLAWAEQYVPTGFAALIVAVTPIWFLVLETFVFRGDRISRRGSLALA